MRKVEVSGIEMKLKKGAKISIDSMIFIYFFEVDERYIKNVDILFDQIESGKIKAVTSVISLSETLSSSKLEQQKEKLMVFENFFYKTPYLETLDVSRDIAVEAAALRRKNKYLRLPDAVQIATGIISGADFFVTNDVRLEKLSIKGIKVVLITEIEDGNFVKVRIS